MSWLDTSGATRLLRDYRAFAAWRLPAAVGLMVAGAVAEGFGILMLVPLIASAMEVHVASEPFRFILAPLQAVSTGNRFAVAIALFVGAMLARSLLLYVRDQALARLESAYEASLQLRAAATLAALGWPAASRVGQSGMQSLLLNEVSRASMAVNRAQAATVAVMLLAVHFAIASLISPGMAAVALLIFTVGYIATRKWTARGLRSGEALTASYEESSTAGFRVHAGLKAALAQGTVAQFLREYRTSLARLGDETVRFAGDQSRARALAGACAAVAAAMLLVIGDRLFGLEFPVLAAVLVLFSRMAGPAQQFQQATQALAAYAPAFSAIERTLGPLQSEPRAVLPARRLEWRELRADGLRYEHEPGLGLAEASFVLGATQWLGISGASGGGKTTLVDLVAGLAQPQRGSLTVDGQPLDATLLPRWQAGLAYVGQGDAVFDDTVRANLLSDSEDTNDADLWAALETVALADRVRALALGLDQPVGDRGSGLSGGERQRLTLARALLRRPSLLILDEATSALDGATEGRIVARLRSLSPRPAAIIVAHRGALLESCEAIGTIDGQTLRIR